MERNEAFSMVISSPVNATIAQATATGIIRNDDTTAVAIYPAAAAGHKVSVSVSTYERQTGQLLRIYQVVGTKNVWLQSFRLSSTGTLPRTTLNKTFSAGQRVTVFAQVVTPGGTFYSPRRTVLVK